MYRISLNETENKKSIHYISTNNCFPYSQEDIIFFKNGYIFPSWLLQWLNHWPTPEGCKIRIWVNVSLTSISFPLSQLSLPHPSLPFSLKCNGKKNSLK